MAIRYAEDRPKDCRYCNFWNERNKKCKLGEEDCYYRLSDKGAETTEKKSICDGCPYGQKGPCIGFCMKKILGN